MKKDCIITLEDSSTINIEVFYKIRHKEIISGSRNDSPNYIDVEECDIEIIKIIGDLPDNFEDQKREYLNEIIEQLIA